MEFEQIVKQLEWLDEEHRKDKAALSALEESIASADGNISILTKHAKELNKKMSAIELTAARLNQFDQILSSQRTDINTALGNLEKNHKRREKDRLKHHQADLEKLNNAIAKTGKDIPEFKKKFKELSDEDLRNNVVLSELQQKVENAGRRNEKIAQSQKLIEDGRRQDGKRVADMQGEITAILKRVDEYHQKTELHGDRVRNIENRFTELISSEAERKQAQAAFLEQQALDQIERARLYKEWLEKFESLKQKSGALGSQTQTLDETLLAVKRAQESYIELNQKLERRINEITELQRLGEERSRQEWVTFKSDDQKRWAGYTLSSDESMRVLRKTVDKTEERATTLEDVTQTIQDQLHQTTDATKQQLQELMNIAHQWITAYERIMGRVRKTPK